MLFCIKFERTLEKNFPVSSRKLFAPISLIFQFIARRNFVLSFRVYCFPLDYFDFSILNKLETLFSNKDRNDLFIYLFILCLMVHTLVSALEKISFYEYSQTWTRNREPKERQTPFIPISIIREFW